MKQYLRGKDRGNGGLFVSMERGSRVSERRPANYATQAMREISSHSNRLGTIASLIPSYPSSCHS